MPGIILAFFLSSCSVLKPAPGTPGKPSPRDTARPTPYKALGKWYQPVESSHGFRQRGLASWYGRKFHGRKTSNGETYDMYKISAAHKTLPFGTYVRVHNLSNGKKLDVRINDRGPFVRGRIIDLSFKAAQELGIVGPGTASVEIVAMGVAVKQEPEIKNKKAYKPVDYYSGNFTFQVGAFIERENAEKLKVKLEQKYKNAHIAKFDNGSQIFYRVRVGKFSTLQQALAQEKIMTDDGYDPIIIAE
ncbi:MAG: septal ring lytic transglycosylase RlpA family lipoprotein [Candidatus Aenigmatarchaeota archaeon]|nr:MAG: septal ring lytic transglycosylase RlpA family lipoprotein [Candidatus Aenigmarchaeota archaeon]